jgi:hypothetical protein
MGISDELLTYADWIVWHKKKGTDPQWVLDRLVKILREQSAQQSLHSDALPIDLVISKDQPGKAPVS